MVSAVLEFLEHNPHLKNMRIDSRQIQAGDIFVAVPGLVTDGRKYIEQAVANGAAVVFAEAPAGCRDINVPVIEVVNLKAWLPRLAALYYGYPSKKLKIIGITGTNGKTSTSHYIAQLLTAAHKKCGVMGTLGNGIFPNLIPTALTTSDCCTLQQQFNNFVTAGVQYVAMEASSIALDQGRLNQTPIDTAVFTNLSQDHLDYHQDMEDYFAAKCKLFTDYKIKNCVINLDDHYAQRLLKLIPSQVNIITYSLYNQAADLYLGNIELQTNLLGKFNQSNALAAIACCMLQGMTLPDLLTAARALQPVTGRMQQMNSDNAGAPMVVVDYAHTPDALVKALQTLREYNPHKLICIFGCGGDRDRLKRSLMLRAVIEHSDQIIITNDNPRTEDPQQIVQDMLEGVDPGSAPITIELDRAKAICQTIARATANDIILIAGKGHEDYQIIGTTKLPFSDQKIALEALEQINITRSKTACS